MRFRVWLANVILALGVAAIVIPFPVAAHAQEECPSVEVLTNIIGQLPVFRIFSGEKAKRAIAVFNAIPPESDIPWTSAYFALRPDGFGVLMVGGEGTICEGVIILPDSVEIILTIIDGVPA